MGVTMYGLVGSRSRFISMDGSSRFMIAFHVSDGYIYGEFISKSSWVR